MPFFKRDNAVIHYEEAGAGEPVIAVHGLIENTAYWSLPGVTRALAEQCRVISMDMRGHGGTRVEGGTPGFTAEAVGADIIALADHCGLDRFHLLAHSTGGFASVRHAMDDSGRFATMILTDTASATALFNGDPDTISEMNDRFARTFEKYSWDQMLANIRKKPGPFFRGIVESGRAEEILGLVGEMLELNDRKVIASFVRSFYTDPSPRIDGLHNIHCPVLIICGGKDDLFIQPSRLMAREIPGAELLEYEGVGHMTALEAPQRLTADILDFIGRHPCRRVAPVG